MATGGGASGAMAGARVFFDAERVTAAELAEARAALGSVRPATYADAAWPDGEAAPALVRSARDLDVQDRAMAWLDRIGERLATQGSAARLGGEPPWGRHGVSFFEAGRHQVFHDLLPWVARVLALGELRGGAANGRLIWRATLARRRDAAIWRALIDDATRAGWDARADLAAPRMSWAMDLAKSLGRPWLLRARRLGAAVRVPVGPPALPADAIWFAEYFPNSVKAAAPVAARVARAGLPIAWLAGRDLVEAALASIGEPCVTPRAAGAAALLRGRLRAEEGAWPARALARLPDEAFRVEERGPVARACLELALIRALVEAAADTAGWIEIFEALFRRARPRAVVSTTYSSGFGRALALVARAHGVPSIYVQHGLMPARPYCARFCNDHMLMWGDYEARAFSGFGLSPGRFHVTGAVIYDELAAAGAPRPFPPSGAPLALAVMASRSGGAITCTDVARRTLRAIAAAARSLRAARVVVKAHPGDTTRIPEEALADFPEVELVRSGAARDVIAAADIVLVASSSTGLEACLLDRPIVVVNLTGAPEVTDLAAAGAALLVEREDDVAPALRRLLDEPATRAALAQGRERVRAERLAGGRGDAASRAARVVLDVVEGRAGASRAAARSEARP